MNDSRRSSPNNVSRSETPNSVASVVYNIHGGHNNLGRIVINLSYFFAPINFGGSIGRRGS